MRLGVSVPVDRTVSRDDDAAARSGHDALYNTLPAGLGDADAVRH